MAAKKLTKRAQVNAAVPVKSTNKVNSKVNGKTNGKSAGKKSSDLAPTKATAKKADVDALPASKKKPAFDFIGSFPIRKNDSDKKNDNKKVVTGPVFPSGEYKVAGRSGRLAQAILNEFDAMYLSKHQQDKLHRTNFTAAADVDPQVLAKRPKQSNVISKDFEDALLARTIDIAVLNMKDIPVELSAGITLAATLRREDPRDAMITRSTYGAIQELPRNARVGAASTRRTMQIKALRPDIEIVPLYGDLAERLKELESGALDGVVVAWATLRRLNVSPRFYVSLQPELMTPGATQGSVGVICRTDDKDLVDKLRYIEDSEGSWSARCERAFLAKLGGGRDVPVGVYAHRKGTQDPWILDSVIGDPRSGEMLKHREIGTSRCKPESLADKAFVGILSKGARKFLPFQN